MKKNAYLAFDFGAESGRAILGSIENNRLHLEEIHRFANGMLNLFGRFHWNIYRLYEEILTSLNLCAEKGISLKSIAFDTWGVDFALLAPDGSVLGLPFAYRDSHTKQSMPQVFETISPEEIYRLTGIAFMQFNSLYQLQALKRDNSPFLQSAKDLLFMPDLFNYMLTGVKKTEFTFATTSQLFNPHTQSWESALFEAIGVSPALMQEVVPPASPIGKLRSDVCKKTGINQTTVTAVASHDTNSAIAAAPAQGENWAYISSGTWSLMGIENKSPIINEQVRKMNFTNEGGIGNSFDFLKNIMGLWLLQQTRKAWSKEKKYDYAELVEISRRAKPFACFVDPDEESFLNPPDMPQAIVEYCRKTGQQPPTEHSAFVRCIFDSLALKYRYVLDQIREAASRQIDKIHVIGGGAQNRLLNQFTANATGVPVVAGPFEATAIGNIMVQALSTGNVSGLSHMRQVVLNSFETETFRPTDRAKWEQAYENFRKLIEQA